MEYGMIFTNDNTINLWIGLTPKPVNEIKEASDFEKSSR